MFASISSPFHQFSLKEASTKHHWSTNGISMFRRLAHSKQIIRYHLNSGPCRQCFITVRPTNHQLSSNKNSTLQRLARKNMRIIFASIDIFTVPSISFKWVINESSLKQQRRIIVLETSTKKKFWSILFASKSSLFQQYIFKKSSNNL